MYNNGLVCYRYGLLVRLATVMVQVNSPMLLIPSCVKFHTVLKRTQPSCLADLYNDDDDNNNDSNDDNNNNNNDNNDNINDNDIGYSTNMIYTVCLIMDIE